MQDGDPENFALLLSMKLPENAIEILRKQKSRLGDVNGRFDIVVGDLIDSRTDYQIWQAGCKNLSLLDFALNLSPALRDTITRDVAQNVSAFEPRLRRKTPTPPPPPQRSYFRRSTPEPAPDPLECHDPREGSVQSKASYLLKPPKAAK